MTRVFVPVAAALAVTTALLGAQASRPAPPAPPAGSPALPPPPAGAQPPRPPPAGATRRQPGPFRRRGEVDPRDAGGDAQWPRDVAAAGGAVSAAHRHVRRPAARGGVRQQARAGV